ncbi:MAG: hypothetical protein HY966_07600 [Ignavibacteriales bacterium]|nr:hypothetical protein [Ignavibacteriales bacterium]
MARTKYVMHECAYCHKSTKMELVGGTQNAQETGAEKSWYRCTRCKHSALLAIPMAKSDKKADAKIDRSVCVEYSKEKVFTIGQAIFFSELNDVGRVIRKDKTSNGIHSIVVSFENSGERKLIENFRTDFSDELATSVAS